MLRLPDRATFLIGAGMSAASGLPGGQKLAAMVFHRVERDVRVFATHAIKAVDYALAPCSGDADLRLELMLELMGRDIAIEVLAGAYSVVLAARPSLAHFIFAASRRPLVTTNQDELVESAAALMGLPVSLTHLHGLASRPATIMTTLGQYSAGLSASTKAAFRSAVAGRHVIVAGYSGRDLDVMPALREAARVTWLLYQERGAAKAEPASEVSYLQDALGSRMWVVRTHDPAHWILQRLPAASRRRVFAHTSSASNIAAPAIFTPEADAAFQQVQLVDKRLAVARVLLHINQPKAALDGLRATARSARGDARVRLRTAEALTMLGEPRKALQQYRRGADLADEPQQLSSALLGSASALAGFGDYAAALADLSQAQQAANAIDSPRARRNMAGKIADSRGRIHTAAGDDASALRDYRAALSAARSSHDLDLTFKVLTFSSDVYRSQGNFNRALHNLDAAFADNELYGRQFTRGWTSYYRGLTRCATGDLASGVGDLQACLQDGERTGNHSLRAWALLTLSSYALINDLANATAWADECQKAMAAHGPFRLCALRLAWHRSELARAQLEYDEALKRVSDLRTVWSRDGRSVPPYMEPHLLAVEGEIARETGHPDAVRLLRDAKTSFLAGGWRHAATRMDVAIWLARGATSTPTRLLARCERESYNLEVQRLKSGDGRRYPLHIT